MWQQRLSLWSNKRGRYVYILTIVAIEWFSFSNLLPIRLADNSSSRRVFKSGSRYLIWNTVQHEPLQKAFATCLNIERGHAFCHKGTECTIVATGPLHADNLGSRRVWEKGLLPTWDTVSLRLRVRGPGGCWSRSRGLCKGS